MTAFVERLLDRQRWRDRVTQASTRGETELPPVVGRTYAAFAVTPPESGDLLALVVAHRGDGKIVVDLAREDLTIAEASQVLRRYGVSDVAGAVDDGSDASARATAGAIFLLREAALQ